MGSDKGGTICAEVAVLVRGIGWMREAKQRRATVVGRCPATLGSYMFNAEQQTVKATYCGLPLMPCAYVTQRTLRLGHIRSVAVTALFALGGITGGLSDLFGVNYAS